MNANYRMELPDIYKTLATASEGIYKEKGSKFITYAYPISCEEEVKEYVDELKKKYYDARHHCYAWQLGADGQNFRANDDGEPSGTAGKPILGQIRSHELTNILIVVIRYFGGTKLGTSGLIRAYKEASMDAINNGEIIEKTINNYYRVNFDYGVMNDVMKVIKDENPQIHLQDFNLRCAIEMSCRQSEAGKLVNKFENIESVSIDHIKTV